MSWSLPFNGKRSIVSDAYHRVALTVQLGEVYTKGFLESAKELALANLLHINLVIPAKYPGSIANAVDSLRRLEQDVASAYSALDSTFVQTSRKLFLSIHMQNDAFPLANSLLSSDLDVDLWILDVAGEKNGSLANIHEMHRLIKQAGKKTHLGIGNCAGPRELDWFLSKVQPEAISLVYLGNIVLPNLFLHNIELVHTAGLTSMVSLTPAALEQDIASSAQLNELARKYDITSDVFLSKCLLQLGCVVSLPFCHYNLPERAESVTRLAHPFVHRRPFVSMFRVISLSITQEDMQVLMGQSEEHEANDDAFWTPHSTARSADRSLTYVK